MENINLVLDNAEEFDQAVHDNTLPECGDLKIITKARATNAGLPAAVLTFTVALPDGKRQRVQTVTTVRLLCQAARAIEAKHGHLLGAN